MCCDFSSSLTQSNIRTQLQGQNEKAVCDEQVSHLHAAPL